MSQVLAGPRRCGCCSRSEESASPACQPSVCGTATAGDILCTGIHSDGSRRRRRRRRRIIAVMETTHVFQVISSSTRTFAIHSRSPRPPSSILILASSLSCPLAACSVTIVVNNTSFTRWHLACPTFFSAPAAQHSLFRALAARLLARRAATMDSLSAGD